MPHIFASVDTFVESSASSLRLGRLVANATFLEALLRHGPFDQHLLFCPSQAEKKRLEEFLRTRPDGALLAQRCQLRVHWDLPEALQAGNIDVMHVGGWSRYLPALAWLRARHSPRLFALTGVIHSLNDVSMASGLERLLRAPLTPADAIFCTSRDGQKAFLRQLEHIAEQSPGTCSVPQLLDVPLGVDERYFATPDRPAARAKLGIPAQRPVILWMGRIAAATKADLVPLLYQFRQIVSEYQNATQPLLVLAGASSAFDQANIRAVVQELGLETAVRLRPDIEDDEKISWLHAADLFVSPVDNHQETFGIAVVEAMACGLPVVVSDWDGYKDLVDDGVSGLRVRTLWTPPPERVVELRGVLEPDLAQLALSQGVSVDPVHLRQCLKILLDNAQLRQQLGQAARTRARALFSWQAVIARATDRWQELQTNAHTGAWHPDRTAVDPAIVSPWETFAHYPTQTLDPDLRVRVSTLGEDIVQGRLPMPATYEDIGPLSDGTLLSQLVFSLRGQILSGSEHARNCAAQCKRPEDEGRYLLLWLLKYGLLESVSD